ncbi:MAG TPA: NAD-dependent epimerase/dehydratase family protein [Bryobacteraceae bacterium]
MILLTGGTGFVGSHVLERLRADGTPVRCVVRPKAARSLDAASMGATEVVAGDLETGVGLKEALAGVETVIHLAGVTKALQREEYYAGNVRATTNLLLAMAGSGARLVHVSSLAAIGPSESAYRPVNEETEPHPLTHYGKSKLEGERLVRASRPDAVIVRPPVVYGPRDTDVFQMLKLVAKGWSLQMTGGERWFSAICVGDLAAGLVRLAASRAGAGRTYYFAHEQPVSWGGLAACAARIMGVKLRVVRILPALALAVGACAEVWAQITGKPGIISREKVAEGRCAAWTCDTEPARAELGFAAATDLEHGLAETLAWYKEAGWLSY